MWQVPDTCRAALHLDLAAVAFCPPALQLLRRPRVRADVQGVVGLLGGLERAAPWPCQFEVGVDRVRAAGLLLALGDVRLHPLLEHRAPSPGSSSARLCVLARVLDQVVELDLGLEVEVGLQGVDQLPLRRAPAVLAHPGALGDVELGLRRARLAAASAARRLRPSNLMLGLDAQQVEDRGHDVLHLAVVGEPLARGHLARLVEDQRDVQRAVVQAVVVEVAVVVVERLAVVGVDDDQRVLLDARARATVAKMFAMQASM